MSRYFNKITDLKLVEEYREEILDAHDLTGKIEKCYSPNVVEIRGNNVWYYGGFEDFLSWDKIKVRDLVKVIKENKERMNG